MIATSGPVHDVTDAVTDTAPAETVRPGLVGRPATNDVVAFHVADVAPVRYSGPRDALDLLQWSDPALPSAPAYLIEDHGDPAFGGGSRTIGMGGKNGGVAVTPRQVLTIDGNPPDANGNAVLSATYVPKAHGLSVKPATFHTTDYMLNNLALIGVDSHGRGYFTNHAGGIFQSDNGMPNLGVYPGDRTANKGIPAGTANNGPSVIVEFKGSLYLMTNLTDGSAQVVSQAARSDGDTLFSWTNVLTMTSGSQVGGGAAVLAQDGAYIYAAEYRDPVGGPSAYRSADGTTWTKVFGPAASNRHIHAIAPDPYNPGHVWMTLGDGGQYYILHSTDYGSTWTEMAPAADAPNWQALQISFSSTHIWFAADNRFSTCFIYERSTGTFKDATPNTHRHIAVPGPVPRNGPNYVTDGAFTSGSTTMTSATAAFTQADVGREVHNTNLPGGRSWIVTVSSATSVILFDKASATATAQPLIFGDEQFYANAPFGAVEPNSGYYYCMASLGTGQRVGWFYTAGPGEPIYLLDPMAQISYGAGLDQIIFWKGYAWGGVTRTKLRA